MLPKEQVCLRQRTAEADYPVHFIDDGQDQLTFCACVQSGGWIQWVHGESPGQPGREDDRVQHSLGGVEQRLSAALVAQELIQAGLAALQSERG